MSDLNPLAAEIARVTKHMLAGLAWEDAEAVMDIAYADVGRWIDKHLPVGDSLDNPCLTARERNSGGMP